MRAGVLRDRGKTELNNVLHQKKSYFFLLPELTAYTYTSLIIHLQLHAD